MATFRISTERGDTFTIQATDSERARRVAREGCNGVRFTVYQQDRPAQTSIQFARARRNRNEATVKYKY